jgi:catechol 2,3-dioxygenase-like lactoylglutathione lyase family enzyme
VAAMSTIGTFLEFGVRTDDILQSLSFYKSLGFTELESSDVFAHKYAVVSDGELHIGLHDTEFDSPAVTFVQPDLATHARSMTDHGFEFTHMRLDEDVFNELAFKDRDGHTITMVEARTFNMSEEAEQDSLCGSWFELTLPVRDTVRAAAFWAPIAPTMLDVREEPTMHMRFDATGVALGLSESIALETPSLCFRCPDREALMTLLEQHGFDYEKFPGFEGAFVAIRAPEGTMLYAFDEDFLGEAYEVDESGDPADFPV